MNRPEHHPLRRRVDGRRRVGTATGWTAAIGGGLAAVFGVLLAQTAPAASAAPLESAGPAQVQPEVAAPPSAQAPAVPTPAAPVTPRHRHTSAVPLQPPLSSPLISSGGGSYGMSGAS